MGFMQKFMSEFATENVKLNRDLYQCIEKIKQIIPEWSKGDKQRVEFFLALLELMNDQVITRHLRAKGEI